MYYKGKMLILKTMRSSVWKCKQCLKQFREMNSIQTRHKWDVWWGQGGHWIPCAHSAPGGGWHLGRGRGTGRGKAVMRGTVCMQMAAKVVSGGHAAQCVSGSGVPPKLWTPPTYKSLFVHTNTLPPVTSTGEPLTCIKVTIFSTLYGVTWPFSTFHF